MAKKQTKLGVLLKKRDAAEARLAAYERKVTLYFNKRKDAQRQLSYYEREIRKEMASPTKEIARIVEV